MDIRWNIINQPTRKWTRKDSTAVSSRAIDIAGSPTGRSINIRLSSNRNLSLIKPPLKPLLEPLLELILHQSSIQKISKKAGRRQ